MVMVAAIATVGLGQAGNYRMLEGRFSVWLPGKPTLDSEFNYLQDGLGRTQKMYASSDDGLNFSAGWIDAQEWRREPPDRLLKRGLSERLSFNSLNAKVLTQKAGKWLGFPCLDTYYIRMSEDNQSSIAYAHSRLVFAEGKIYDLLLESAKPLVRSTDQRFFGSLRIGRSLDRSAFLIREVHPVPPKWNYRATQGRFRSPGGEYSIWLPSKPVHGVDLSSEPGWGKEVVMKAHGPSGFYVKATLTNRKAPGPFSAKHAVRYGPIFAAEHADYISPQWEKFTPWRGHVAYECDLRQFRHMTLEQEHCWMTKRICIGNQMLEIEYHSGEWAPNMRLWRKIVSSLRWHGPPNLRS